jgi:hypothetical protein
MEDTKDDRLAYVYHLTDSTGQVRYVGSAYNPYRRMLTRWYDGDTPFIEWMKAEYAAGRIVEMLIVSAHDTRDAASVAERREIQRQKALGAPLMNFCYTGSGNSTWARSREIYAKLKVQVAEDHRRRTALFGKGNFTMWSKG